MTSAPFVAVPAIDLVFQKLGLGGPDSAWRSTWPVTQSTFEPPRLDFLNVAYVEATCRRLRMGAEATEACSRAVHFLQQNELLQRLAWHYYVCWFVQPADFPDTPPVVFPDSLADESALLYTLVFLSGVPALRAIHRKRNIPESITLDTLSDLERWMSKYRQRHGCWGLDQVAWLRIHFAGRIFALGRLQFEMTGFPLEHRAYRERQSRQVVVVAPEGMRFRTDGNCAGIEDPSAWTAHFRIDDRHIHGTALSPRGYAVREPIELPVSDWEPILKKDDPALSVHIPEAGPMDHAACGESFREAVEFFPEHFPDYAFRAFMCFSWLLDPRFEETLSTDSNIVRFLREFYLFTVPFFNPIGSFPHIFDGYTGDLDNAPQRTSLQRITLQHLKAGGEWRTGGALLFPEDLAWGEQLYRKPPHEVTGRRLHS